MTAPARSTPGSHVARSTIEDALEGMRRDFCAGLDARICRIESARLDVASDTRAALESLKFEAHRICGVAGSLGLNAVSAQARALEEHVGRIEGRPLSPDEQKELNRRVEDFLDLLEDHLTDD
ncbi:MULTISPECIES: Hpt domain-containing protein [unclassified Roseovarius]|uniref:Hpt domain-containing protein n=1 Tax=unclassified Roseovarius TaxID=2614913 RepID=UPI0027402188|nr:Hpt domain-containing protein [Roseovarius sp. MMSF_3350]